MLTPLKPGGMMPTTVCDSPFSTIVRLRIARSPPKRRIHKRWLRITALGPPRRDSSSVNVRPSIGGAPSRSM